MKGIRVQGSRPSISSRMVLKHSSVFIWLLFQRVTNKRQPVSETGAKMAKWDMGDAGWATPGAMGGGLWDKKGAARVYVLRVRPHTGAPQTGFGMHSDSP